MCQSHGHILESLSLLLGGGDAGDHDSDNRGS